MKFNHKFRMGFTLIELLVVVAIIALLVSILLPALKNARVQARRVVCAAQMHSLGTGLALYLNDNRDTFPTNTDNWVQAQRPGWGPDDWWEGTGKALAMNAFGVEARLGLGKLFPLYAPEPKLFRCPGFMDVELHYPPSFVGLSIEDFMIPVLVDPSTHGTWSYSNYANTPGWHHPVDRYDITELGHFYESRPQMSLIVDYDWSTPYNHPSLGGQSPAGWNVYRVGGDVEWMTWRNGYPDELKSLEDAFLVGGDYEMRLSRAVNRLSLY